MARNRLTAHQSIKPCLDCGRNFRGTQSGADQMVCDECYELAGYFNMFQDGDFDVTRDVASCVNYALAAHQKGGSLERIVAEYPDMFPLGMQHFKEITEPLFQALKAEAIETTSTAIGALVAKPNGRSWALVDELGRWLLAAPSSRPGYPTPLRLFRSEESAKKWIKAHR